MLWAGLSPSSSPGSLPTYYPASSGEGASWANSSLHCSPQFYLWPGVEETLCEPQAVSAMAPSTDLCGPWHSGFEPLRELGAEFGFGAQDLTGCGAWWPPNVLWSFCFRVCSRILLKEQEGLRDLGHWEPGSPRIPLLQAPPYEFIAIPTSMHSLGPYCARA